MHAALERLQRTDVSQELTRLGVALGGKGAVIDLSAIAGANWETRVQSDVALFARYVSVEPVDQIETVTTTITADPGNIVVSQSTTAP
jgi:hypothetical protein